MDDPLPQRTASDSGSEASVDDRTRAGGRRPLLLAVLAIAALLVLLHGWQNVLALTAGGGDPVSPSSDRVSVDCAPGAPVAATDVPAWQGRELAQACPPPPRCRADERPCYISRNASGCITWRCCRR